MADAVERKVDADILLRGIQKSINALPLRSRQRIYLKYLSATRQYDYEIYSNQNISESTYYRELGQAQIDFSESFRNGELITYKVKIQKMGDS